MAIHSDITPSLLNFLSNQYGLDFPQDMPFISGPLAADKSFSSELDIALIRNKNGTNDYVEGEYLLSDDRLYTILPNLDLEPTINEQVKTRLIEKLKKFKSNSIYACDNNRLDKKGYGSRNQMLSMTALEHTFIKSIGLDQFNPEQQFEKARQLSYDGDFVKSRAILKYVLNRSPNYHDARILLARTFGWDQQYDSAIFYIKQTIDRAPLYTDAFCAWADVAYWRGDHNEALSIIEKGLMVSEHDNELLARKARALMKLGKSNEANRLINDILAVAPFAETAIEVRRQLFKK
jgi:tetratricopeptide (TPR) repeat protein